jgi:hypothetical protein
MIFAKKVLNSGGTIQPLVIPTDKLIGPSVANPSILVDEGQVLVNLRNLNYFLYHAEQNKFEHKWGPLVYLHPEADQTLTTYNFISTLDEDLRATSCAKVDTSSLDMPPLWTFVGLEDARLVKWDGKLYLCGVRRDTTTNGEGRMELSEIVIEQSGEVKEVSRVRVPVPSGQESYCEKNWMPVLDHPYTFIKWCNPTEVVTYDPLNKTTTSVVSEYFIPNLPDWRGGSQVIPFDNGYLALVHETFLYQTEPQKKDAHYLHRFIFWDKNFNLSTYSKSFNFLDGKVEFCCGMAELDNNLLITFALQDNSSYVIKAPKEMILDFINE